MCFFVVVVCLALGLCPAALTFAYSLLLLLCVVCSFVFGVCFGLSRVVFCCCLCVVGLLGALCLVY